MMRGPELHLGGGKLAICRRHNCHSLSMMFQNENVSMGARDVYLSSTVTTVACTMAAMKKARVKVVCGQ